MTEEFKDPCELIEEPSSDLTEDPSAPEEPIEVLQNNTPGFPVREISLERDSRVVRDCLMIPQQSYFASLPTVETEVDGVISSEIVEEYTPPRDPGAPFLRAYNLGSQVDPELVDMFLFRAGKVYDNTKFMKTGQLRYINADNEPTLPSDVRDASVPFRTVVGRTWPSVLGRPDIVVSDVKLVFPFRAVESHIRIILGPPRNTADAPDIATRAREWINGEYDNKFIVRLEDPSVTRPLSGYTPKNEVQLIDVVESPFEDFAFRVPAAFFERELKDLRFPAVDYASVKTGMPDFSSYPADGLLGDEIVHIIRETEGTSEIMRASDDLPYPEIRKHSLYRKYAMEYGTEDIVFAGLGGTQYGGLTGEIIQSICPDNDVVQKFPASKVEKITEINSLLASPDNQPGFYSWGQNNLGTYTEISFNMAHRSTIASIFKEASVDTMLLELLDKGKPSNPRFFTQVLDQKFGWIEENTGVGINDQRVLNHRPNKYDNPFKEIKRELMVREDLATLNLAKISESEYPLSFLGAEAYEQDPDAYRLFATFGLMSAETRAHDHSRGKERTLENVLSRDPCYSEVVAYRVEKSDRQTGTILQNFYFFNNPDTYDFKFIDNQVMFGREYTYKIYTINFVIGAHYNYQHQLVQDDTGRLVNRGQSLDWDFPQPGQDRDRGFRDAEIYFSAFFKRVYSVIEAPYFQQTVLIGDRPPLFPEVQFLPFADQDDRFMLLFLPRIGHFRQEPIAILPGDQEIIENMFLRQNSAGHTPLEDNRRIEYKSDTPPTEYQMIIITSPPVGYESFTGGELYETTFRAPFFNVGATPNVEYYAIFRAVDKGGISNPSEIYKIVLNSYADGLYPTFELYQPDFSEEAYPVTFERLISIAPATEQTVVNFSSEDEPPSQRTEEFYSSAPNLEETNLGQEGNSIYNKRYKIRVSSVQSGRAFDVNLNWTYRSQRITTDDLGNVIIINDDRDNSQRESRCDAPAQERANREAENRRRSDLGARRARPDAVDPNAAAVAAANDEARDPDTGLLLGSTEEEDSAAEAEARDAEDERERRRRDRYPDREPDF